MSTPIRETLQWEVFPGKNKLCCDGRCICARSLYSFYCSLAMILIPSLLFFAFECRFLTFLLTPFIPALAVVQFLFVLSALFCACLTDPGIMPRATADEAAWLQIQIAPTPDSSSPSPPRVKEVMINSRVVKLKYCYTCKIFRPPRTSHCSACDNCVERFDHHCPWVGNCVGRRNYRYFFVFITSLTLYCAFILSFTIVNFVLLGLKSSFVEALKKCPLSIVVVLSAFFGMWAVGGIALYHISLIAREVSTNEAIKGTFTDKKCNQTNNPFNRGNLCGNMAWLLCGPMYPSIIHLRDPIDDEQDYGDYETIARSRTSRGYCCPVVSAGYVKSQAMRHAARAAAREAAAAAVDAAVTTEMVGTATDVTNNALQSSSSYTTAVKFSDEEVNHSAFVQDFNSTGSPESSGESSNELQPSGMTPV